MRTRRHYFDRFERHSLAKDPDHAKLGGVCAGVARYLDISRFFVRLCALIALCVAPQVILLAYGIAWLVLDEDPERG